MVVGERKCGRLSSSGGVTRALGAVIGRAPSAVKGMSSCRYVMPIVPFCPWREANLSPICGMRTERTRTLTNLRPSWLVVSIT